MLTGKSVSLNPCSNGMWIEPTSKAQTFGLPFGLNPCSNGMWIELVAIIIVKLLFDAS